MSGIVLDGFAGPGGWSVAMQRLRLLEVGIELDAAACATRAAAGHLTIRADVSRFPAEHLAGKVTGSAWSPPCVFFSAAGTRAGSAVIEVLADSIRDEFAGRMTKAQRRREMAAVLRKAGWPDPKTPRSPSYAKMPRLGKRRGKRQVITSPGRGNAIWKAVRSAHLVVEPARFIAATRPEWVALEQVPDVLPLWQVYAAELRRMGYSAWCGKLNAADYGVPQTRERAILIASRVRRVSCPPPTHYDPRKGMQLFGEPWVSMADALGLSGTGLPAGPYRTSPGDRTQPREFTEPATTVAFGHSSMVLRRDRGAGLIERGGERADHQVEAPAPTITAGNKGSGPRLSWVMQRQVGASRQEGRRDHPVTEPAPTITGGGSAAGSGNGAGLRWALRNNTQSNAAMRSLDEPAGTMFFGHRGNDVSWVLGRPATTVQGDPRVGRPGHKNRDPGGESQFAEDSVRVSVAEAAALQSFPAGYPWQGTKTKQYEQVGNAVPPGLAMAVLGEAAGIDWQPVAEKYALETRLIAEAAA